MRMRTRGLARLSARGDVDRAADLITAGFALHFAGDLDRAISVFQEAVAAARRAGAIRHLSSALVNLAQAEMAAGRVEAAGSLLDEVEALVASDVPEIAAVVGGYRADWYRETGDLDRALEHYVRAVEAPTYLPWYLSGLALTLGALGDLEAALEVGASTIACARERGIDVAALSQVGELLDVAMARWRSEAGPAGAAAEAAGRSLADEERVGRAQELARRTARSTGGAPAPPSVS